MQPSRRRRDGPRFAREKRLIVVGVARVRSALAGDIGRQRHRALLRDGRVERGAGKIEAKRDFAALALGLDAGRERAELDALADAQLLGRPRQRAPMRLRKPLDQRRLYVGFRLATRAKPIEPRANDSRVVDDQRVAGPQQAGEVRYMEIIESRGAGGNDQQRALSRGLAGRRAIASGGSSKSKRSTRIYSLECRAHAPT